MSSKIYIKRVDAAAWVRDMERVAALPSEDEQDEVNIEILYQTGESPEQVMFSSEALDGLNAYHKIKDSMDEEISRKTERFLNALPPRYSPEETPTTLGIQYETSLFGGWLLTQQHIEQLIGLAQQIEAYCEAQVRRIESKLAREAINMAGFTWLEWVKAYGSTKRQFQDSEKRRGKFCEIWGLVEDWRKILEKVSKSDAALYVFEC